jgi:isopentenyldiphosphate isomerase
MKTDADEALEVLDDEGLPTGVIKPRAAIHRDGDWHHAFHLWVVHPDGCVLLQRRSRSKDVAAGKVDVSVGGHVRPGEALPDVLREAEEEIGLALRPGETEYLETLRAERTYPDGSLDREFQDVYAALVADRTLEDYSLDCREVSVVYEAPLAGLLALYREGGSLPVAGWDCQARRNNALLVEEDLIAEAREQTTASLERLLAWWEGRVGAVELNDG